MTAEDVAKIVAAELSKATAEKNREAEEAAKKAAAERITTLEQALAAAGKVEHARATPFGDPHKGAGLNHARYVKAKIAAQRFGISPVEFAKKQGMPEEVVKALSMSVMADGGALVPDQFSSEFIPLLRAATVVLESGARTVEFTGSMSMGRQNSAATASYVGELQALTPSQPTVGLLQLQEKKLAALVPVSNDLLRNPSASADAIIRDDLVRVMALARDLALIRGQGSVYSPKGILNWANSANKFNMSNTGALADKVADLSKAIRLVEEANVPMTRCGWLFTPRTKWALAATLDGQGKFVFADQIAAGTLFGYPYKTTTQIPNNLGGGANQSEIYFGDFNTLVFGEAMGQQVELFNGAAYTDANSLQRNGVQTDESVIRCVEKHDLVAMFDKAFSVVQQVTWS